MQQSGPSRLHRELLTYICPAASQLLPPHFCSLPSSTQQHPAPLLLRQRDLALFPAFFAVPTAGSAGISTHLPDLFLSSSLSLPPASSSTLFRTAIYRNLRSNSNHPQQAGLDFSFGPQLKPSHPTKPVSCLPFPSLFLPFPSFAAPGVAMHGTSLAFFTILVI